MYSQVTARQMTPRYVISEDDDGSEPESSKDEEQHICDPTILADGIDLTGDTDYTESNWYAIGVFMIICFASVDFFIVLGDKIPSSEWKDMVLFGLFLLMIIVMFMIAVFMSLGNSVRLDTPLAWGYSLLGTVATYAILLIFRIVVMWPMVESGNTNQTILRTVLEVAHFGISCLLIMDLVSWCTCRKTHSTFEQKTAVVLQRDSQGSWEEDDVHRFIQEAGVKENYFEKENEKYMSYPGFTQTLKEYFYPQPFMEVSKFPDSDHLREVANRARITYPPRFRCSFIVIFLFIVIQSTLMVIVGVNLCTDDAYVDSILHSFSPKLEDIPNMTATLEDTQQALTHATNEVNQAIANGDLGTLTTFAPEAARLSMKFARDEAQLVLLVAEHTALKKGMRTIGHSLYVMTPIVALLCLWFVYVSALAYRKGILELALSRPHYRFHPQWQNFLSDKKFCGMYISCFELSYGLLLAIGLGVAWLVQEIDWKNFWHDWKGTIIAMLIYYVLSLVVLPKIHGMAVSGENGELARPRLQAAFIFVWEIFYFVQMASSVLMHVGCALLMTILMLLRPDQFLMRTGWEYLDMMFFVYSSMQFEQLQSGIRKHKKDTRID